jgi:hypothetical protein
LSPINASHSFGSWLAALNEPFTLRQSLLIAPVGISILDAVKGRPFCKAFRNAINFYLDVAGSVVGLFFSSGPSAIFFAIPKVIINPLQSHAVWTRTHVINKALEVMPTVAQGYAASSVSVKKPAFGVQASGFHVHPYSIGFGAIETVPIKTIVILLFQASARLFCAACQSMRSSDGFAATVAFAQPCSMIFPYITGPIHNHKPSKSLPI